MIPSDEEVLMLPKILLVEDDDVIREIYAMKFQLEGFEVETAANGRIGLQKIDAFQPHIVLLDMMMPVMGGLDFMQELASSKQKPHVIVFSNISEPDRIDAVLKLGAKAYWTKSDFTPERCVIELSDFWKQTTS